MRWKSDGVFWGSVPVFLILGMITLRKVDKVRLKPYFPLIDFIQPGPMNVDLTTEMKGWMQMVITCYHLTLPTVVRSHPTLQTLA